MGASSFIHFIVPCLYLEGAYLISIRYGRVFYKQKVLFGAFFLQLFVFVS
jgi:hypothetical protein